MHIFRIAAMNPAGKKWKSEELTKKAKAKKKLKENMKWKIPAFKFLLKKKITAGSCSIKKEETQKKSCLQSCAFSIDKYINHRMLNRFKSGIEISRRCPLFIETPPSKYHFSFSLPHISIFEEVVKSLVRLNTRKIFLNCSIDNNN